MNELVESIVNCQDFLAICGHTIFAQLMEKVVQIIMRKQFIVVYNLSFKWIIHQPGNLSTVYGKCNRFMIRLWNSSLLDLNRLRKARSTLTAASQLRTSSMAMRIEQTLLNTCVELRIIFTWNNSLLLWLLIYILSLFNFEHSLILWLLNTLHRIGSLLFSSMAINYCINFSWGLIIMYRYFRNLN